MSSATRRRGFSPSLWVPTLYFAEGLPFYAVNMMALIFYSRMGVSNATITATVSLLGLPWSLKPLWSPFLEMYKTKKFFVVLLEFVGGLSLGLLALCLPLPGYFRYSVALFAVIGFCASTHDIAADGLYIASLTPRQQAAYAGWQGGFFNIARFVSQGGLLILAGYLENRMPVARAWMMIFGSVGVTMVLVGLFHARVLPSGGAAVRPSRSQGTRGTPRCEDDATRETKEFVDRVCAAIDRLAIRFFRLLRVQYPPVCHERIERFRNAAGEVLEEHPDFTKFCHVVISFCMKPHIWFLLLFVFLYRAGEGQVVKIGPLFLKAARDTGGLGLSTAQFGTIYGTFGTAAFILGSVLGGYFAAWLGLKRALLPLILVMNLPMLTYFYLSTAMPTSSAMIAAAMSLEMFGYGFGFVGVMLVMMQEIAPGKYQTAHYAFANSLMNLGLIVPGAVSGLIQTKIGYQHFFLWVLISAIPAMILARFVPIHGLQVPVESLESAEV